MPNRDTKQTWRHKRVAGIGRLSVDLGSPTTAHFYGSFSLRVPVRLIVIFPVSWFPLSRLFWIFATQKLGRARREPVVRPSSLFIFKFSGIKDWCLKGKATK